MKISQASFFYAIFWVCLSGSNLSAQIFEPEGLNIPGQYNAIAPNNWHNPPTNHAFASSTQTSGGRVSILFTMPVKVWQTSFSVNMSGADIQGGTYNWLFTSGQTTAPYQNKWAGVSVTLNSIQSYSHNAGTDNMVTYTNGKWYTVNWRDNGYTDTDAIIMETDAQPVDILSVSGNYSGPGVDMQVTATLSSSKSSEDILLRYTTNNFGTSTILNMSCTGTTCTATVPASAVGDTDQYKLYVLSSTLSGINHSNADIATIKLNNNSGGNYQMSILPVHLTSFTATPKGSTVQLDWATAMEQDNDHFAVERSADGRAFADLAKVAGAGTTLAPQQYTYTDLAPQPGFNYYRLRQVDHDGTTEIHRTVVVDMRRAAGQPMHLAPTPAQDRLTVQWREVPARDTELLLFNMQGQVLLRQSVPAGQPAIDVDVSGLPAGHYYLRTGGEGEAVRFIKG